MRRLVRMASARLAHHERQPTTFMANAWEWIPETRTFRPVRGGVWTVHPHGGGVPEGVRFVVENGVGEFGKAKDDGEASAFVGLMGGAALGAAMGGPIGALIGAVAGAILGKNAKGVG
jgi:hypothetical protein